MKQKIQFGIDVLLQQWAAYQNKRIALVTNDAACTSGGILSRVALMKKGFHITKLFSPRLGSWHTKQFFLMPEKPEK